MVLFNILTKNFSCGFRSITNLTSLCFCLLLLPIPSWGQPKTYVKVPDQKPKVTEPSRRFIRVLCINGGGVRGIIPARILQEFEEKSGKPIHQLFDLIVGTSTGGIIALAVTMPDSEHPQKPMYKAQDLVNFYLQESPQIFCKSIWRTLRTGFGIWGARYDRKNLDDALLRFLKDGQMSQSLSHVGVLSYSIDKHLPCLWTSYRAKQKASKDHYIRNVAAATSAAPTYFDAKAITDAKTKETLTEIDGGIYANNPAVGAVIAVGHLYPKFRREDLIVVSLCTGQSAKHEHSMTGLKSISHLINDMMDANGELVDGVLDALLLNYYNFQIKLPKNLMPMDKCDKGHLEKLIKLTEQELLDKRQNDINALLEKLVLN